MPEEQYKNVIDRLIYYRKHLGLTQEEMARLLGISQSEYSKIENGHGRLSYKHLRALHANDWDIDYLVTGNRCSSPPGGLNDILSDCSPEEFDTIYVYIIQSIFLYWNEIFRTNANPCLYSEIKIMIVMIAHQATQPDVLKYIRTGLGMNKKEFGEFLDITRKTYSRCEAGASELDMDHILRLYNNRICNPLFIVDYKRELLDKINYELQFTDSEIRQWFCGKIMNELEELRKLKDTISK